MAQSTQVMASRGNASTGKQGDASMASRGDASAGKPCKGDIL